MRQFEKDLLDYDLHVGRAGNINDINHKLKGKCIVLVTGVCFCSILTQLTHLMIQTFCEPHAMSLASTSINYLNL